MLASPLNWQDIRKYYENTYVKLREYGDRVFYFNKVREDCINFTDREANEGIIYLSEDSPYEINMELPNKAIFQCNDSAVYLYRIPQRQYYKGISAENCRLVRFTPTGKTTAISVNHANLEAYTQKLNYRSLVDILDDPNVERSEAISRRFAYCYGHIYCDDRNIGKILPKTHAIRVSALLTPEIQALLGPNSKYKVMAA